MYLETKHGSLKVNKIILCIKSDGFKSSKNTDCGYFNPNSRLNIQYCMPNCKFDRFIQSDNNNNFDLEKCDSSD